MKHFILTTTAFLACGMLAVCIPSAEAQNNTARIKSSCKAAAVKADAKHKPQVIKQYFFEPYSNDWFLETVDSIRYNDALKPVYTTTDYYADVDVVEYNSRKNIAYNDNGNIAEEFEEVSFDSRITWDKYSLTRYKYDAMLKNTLTTKDIMYWDVEAEEWVYDDYVEGTFAMAVTRDADDRVIEAVQYSNSAKTDIQAKRVFGYGEDGRVSSITWDLQNDASELVPMFIQEDIEWTKTNNQFITPETNAYEPFKNDEENLIENYVMYNRNADGTKGEVENVYRATYDDQMRLIGVGMKIPATEGMYKCNYNYDIDENGSYEINKMQQSVVEGVMKMTTERRVVMMNSFGDIVSEEIYVYDSESDEESLAEAYKYDRTYDAEGNLTEMVMSQRDEGTGEPTYSLLEKTEYADYTEDAATGISHAEGGRAEISVCNGIISVKNGIGAIYVINDMQGKTVGHGIVKGEISTEGLPSGMYIVSINSNNANNAVKLIKK